VKNDELNIRIFCSCGDYFLGKVIPVDPLVIARYVILHIVSVRQNNRIQICNQSEVGTIILTNNQKTEDAFSALQISCYPKKMLLNKIQFYHLYLSFL
jgi:hypothetical protein